MTVQRGDVVLVDFPFSSGTGSKLRPALVVQNDKNNGRLASTIIVMITGTAHRTGEATQVLIDVATPDGKQTGLKFTSAVTCENLFTIQQKLVRGTIGSLPFTLLQQVDDALKASVDV